MSDNSATNLAAWWGASVATLLLFWDVYKWISSSRANIVVSISPNMKILEGVSNVLSESSYVLVEAVNKGNKKTTITLLVGRHYTSLINKLLKKAKTHFFMLDPVSTQPLPHIWEPGERWLGKILHNEILEKVGCDGYLYCGIYHSLREKAVLKRVVIHKK